VNDGPHVERYRFEHGSLNLAIEVIGVAVCGELLISSHLDVASRDALACNLERAGIKANLPLI